MLLIPLLRPFTKLYLYFASLLDAEANFLPFCREVKIAMSSGLGAPGLTAATLAEAESPSMPTTDAAPPAVEVAQLRSPSDIMFKPGWQVSIPSRFQAHTCMTILL